MNAKGRKPNLRDLAVACAMLVWLYGVAFAVSGVVELRKLWGARG